MHCVWLVHEGWLTARLYSQSSAAIVYALYAFTLVSLASHSSHKSILPHTHTPLPPSVAFLPQVLTLENYQQTMYSVIRATNYASCMWFVTCEWSWNQQTASTRDMKSRGTMFVG